MSFGSPPPAPMLPPMPATPPGPPAFGMAPQGAKPGRKSMQTTFLGTGDIANPVGPGTSSMFGGKTLLGT